MYGLQVDNEEIPMHPTLLPPSLEMLHGQVTWLTEKIEALKRDNVILRREIDWLRDAPRADKDLKQKGADPPMFTGNQRDLEG